MAVGAAHPVMVPVVAAADLDLSLSVALTARNCCCFVKPNSENDGLCRRLLSGTHLRAGDF